MRERITYTMENGILRGVKSVHEPSRHEKKETLRTRKIKNAERKTLMELIKERKKESEAAPINYYKKQSHYKDKNLRDRRKYNQIFRAVYKQHEDANPEEKRFLMYRESLPKGTSMNFIPNVNLNSPISPLYTPDVTKEEDAKRREGLKAWTKLREEWAKSDTKRKTRRRKPQKSNRKTNKK